MVMRRGLFIYFTRYARKGAGVSERNWTGWRFPTARKMRIVGILPPKDDAAERAARARYLWARKNRTVMHLGTTKDVRAAFLTIAKHRKWSYTKTFREMVKMMMKHCDLEGILDDREEK